MYKKLFWAWFAILLLSQVLPLGDRVGSFLLATHFSLRFDYLFHTLTYMMFAVIYLIARNSDQKAFLQCSFNKYMVIIALLAIIIEFIQLLLPYRTFNLFDIAFNLLGALFGIFLVILSKKI